MSLQETQPVASHGFSLRSMLLLVILLGIGAGATTYVLGNVFATVAGAPSTGTSQQTTTARARLRPHTTALSQQPRGRRPQTVQTPVFSEATYVHLQTICPSRRLFSTQWKERSFPFSS